MTTDNDALKAPDKIWINTDDVSGLSKPKAWHVLTRIFNRINPPPYTSTEYHRTDPDTQLIATDQGEALSEAVEYLQNIEKQKKANGIVPVKLIRLIAKLAAITGADDD